MFAFQEEKKGKAKKKEAAMAVSTIKRFFRMYYVIFKTSQQLMPCLLPVYIVSITLF